MLAKIFSKFKTNDTVIIFASGVSNSKESDEAQFIKEFSLVENTLQHTNQNQLFVYFSTYSINDKSLSDTKYVQHKLKIENYIQKNTKSFLIFRISNIVGKTNNPNTITNFLHNNIMNEKQFEIWNNAYRNIIDIDDVYKNVTYCIENNNIRNRIINIINTQNYNIKYIVSIFEMILEKKAKFKETEKGANFELLLNEIELQIYQNTNTTFDDKYLENTINKYYG